MQACDGAKGNIARNAASGQVAAQCFPLTSLVKRTMQPIGCHVQDIGLVAAEPNGRLPIPAQWRFTQFVLWVQAIVLSTSAVLPTVPAKLRAGKHHIGIARIYFHLHAIATTNHLPTVLSVLLPSRRRFVLRGTDPSAIVLKSTVDIVGVRIVHFNRIKLSHCRAVAFYPMRAAIPRYIDASIVAVDEVFWIRRIGPEEVVIDVHIGRSN